MKIEQHEIALQTQYRSSETELTRMGDEWKKTLVQEMRFQQIPSLDDAQEALQEVKEDVQDELINTLLNLFDSTQRLETGSAVAPKLIPLGELDQKEFKRLDIPFSQVTYTEEREVSECVNASIQGCVCTSDGREIPLDVNLSMSQSFYKKVEFSQTVFTDPLVVNFNGELPNLETASFAFDIDCDGESDQISKLSEGNGFLALDKNDNGSIDDGSELFGVESGNGFADLAAYDEDGNDWIDEGDDIFDQLRIWTTDGETSRLVALGEAGIGAIYLGSAASEFTYRNNNGGSLGALRASGMFLYESGRSGNISQIDFAKQSEDDGSSPLQQALSTLDV